jgi:hypothetical protein
MKGRKVRDVREPCDAPALGRRHRHRFLHALEGAHPADVRRASDRRVARAHRCQRNVEKIETKCFGLERVRLRSFQARPEQISQHHGAGGKQSVRCRVPAVVTVEPVMGDGMIESQRERTIADRAREADAIRRVRGDEHGMARRSGHVPAGRVVPRKYAADRQHHDMRILPLDLAARVRHRTRREQADVQGVACK